MFWGQSSQMISWTSDFFKIYIYIYLFTFLFTYLSILLLLFLLLGGKTSLPDSISNIHKINVFRDI